MTGKDMLTTTEPFDPILAVFDGALAIKDVAAGLEDARPGAAALLRMIAWHLKTAAELLDAGWTEQDLPDAPAEETFTFSPDDGGCNG